eukprot:GHVN01069012.1.p1 GENE.GHVN01069012.1~~GHVN01069012.1.p1  ORF type:complete len:145 (-),score=18.67 GHVN01069012.1:364-798(-)
MKDQDGYGDFIGGIGTKIGRNFFGSHIDSFIGDLTMMGRWRDLSCKALCIRAPAILEVEEGVEVLSKLTVPSGSQKGRTIIAAASVNNIMVTIFHPEINGEVWIHQWFVDNYVIPHTRSKQATDKIETTAHQPRRQEAPGNRAN